MAERLMSLKPCFVYYVPEVLEPGILYVAESFEVAVHLCACGCGEKTVTPIDARGGWTLVRKADVVTLQPSIFNRQTCGAHYFVTKNAVQWV